MGLIEKVDEDKNQFRIMKESIIFLSTNFRELLNCIFESDY